MKKISCCIFSLLLSLLTLSSQNINGVWEGKMEAAGQTLTLTFYIDEKEGQFSSLMDVKEQMIRKMPTTRTTFQKKSLTIAILRLGALFEGSYKKGVITGVFKQSGLEFPLTLMPKDTVKRRPQNPVKPYPYQEEEVMFENEKAGVKLSGTLTYPSSGSAFSAVVLISGSGAQNRNSSVFGHDIFRVIADYLTRNGIAVLRYDDRGAGQSEGIYEDAFLQDFAEDAMSGVAYLKSRKEIDPNRVGVVGHSEGGAITFMLGGQHPELSFIISLAGPAIDGNTLMVLQRAAIGKASGVSEQAIAKNEKLLEAMNALILKYGVDSVRRNAKRYLSELPETGNLNSTQREYLASQLIWIASPEMQSLKQYDPTEDLRKIVCPTFALYGEKDLQVPAAVNAETIQKIGNPHITTKIYPALNHIFQHATTGLPNEYEEIEETFSTDVLEEMVRWIKAR